ncbi:MAG: DUF4157 domain-containing protein [Nannocystaceae bacterium]
MRERTQARRTSDERGGGRGHGRAEPEREESRPGNRAVVQRMEGAAASPGEGPLSGGIRGLPAGLRAGLEALSGISVADTTVHYDSPAPARVGALAFARGATIHLGPQQEHHLPHEAWHVVQQKQGRVSGTHSLGGERINRDRGLEREASHMGEQAARHGASAAPRSIVERSAPTHVTQRIEAAQDPDGHWISQIAPGRAIDEGEGYIRVTNFAAISDTTFGSLLSKDHAYVGIEYVDNNTPNTIFTDLTHDGVRLYDGLQVQTGGLTVPDTGGQSTRHLLGQKMHGGYTGTTYRITADQAQAAVTKARAVAGGYFGKTPPRGVTPTYKFSKHGWGVGTDHYTNCARFARKLLKAAGIEVSFGLAKTPYQIANIEDPSKDESILDATTGVDAPEMTKSLKELTTTSSFGSRHAPTGGRPVRLTDDQVLAIELWTRGIGGPMASFLRGTMTEGLADAAAMSSTAKKPMQDVIDALNAGLDRLPDRAGKSYRKSKAQSDAVYRTRIKPGDYVMDKSLLATATVRGVSSIGTWGAPGNVWFEVRGTTGKYIAPYSSFSEKEVLYRAETVFKVDAIKLAPNETVFVIMTEATPPTPTTPIKNTFTGLPYPPPPPIVPAPTLTTGTTTTTTTTDTTTDTTTTDTTTDTTTTDTTTTDTGLSSLLPTLDPTELKNVLTMIQERYGTDTTTDTTTDMEDETLVEDKTPVLSRTVSTRL